MIKRHWTPHEADEWCKEDWIAIVLSPLCYILLTLGTALTIFMLVSGYIMLGAGIVLTVLLHWVIDPKLKAISAEYESKQQQYLSELEAKVRWEHRNPDES